MTRTQFITSICAIPFIGKLFKSKPLPLRFGTFDEQMKYIPFGEVTKDGSQAYFVKLEQTNQPHLTGGKITRHFINEKGEWVFEDVV